MHLAIYLTNASNKDGIIQQIVEKDLLQDFIDLKSLKGEIYSTLTLNHFINEELIHGHFEITTKENSSLISMSSGQQKLALITHLLSKKPDFIIIDDVFSNLDTFTQAAILETLTSIAERTILIQIFHRKKELMPFIESICTLEGKAVLPINREEFLETINLKATDNFNLPIPKSLVQYDFIENPLIQFKNVSVNYEDKKVLDKINWTINKGEFWQIIGENGSGKSTILSMITGDNPKAYGQNIMLFGRKKGSGETVWEIKKRIGYCNTSMTQQFARLDSIEKMVISGFFDQIGLYTKPTELQIKIARDWLNLLGLSTLKNKPFNFLPLGQQRMVLVARAMVKHPTLLILDEPTAGLDDKNVAIFTALINKIAAESETAILYVSHRNEVGLNPDKIYELIAGENGSVGIVSQ